MTPDHYPQPEGFAPVPLRAALLGAVAASVLCACGGANTVPVRAAAAPYAPPASYAEATDASRRSNEVLMRAIGLVGTPYRHGGNTPAGGFDCSGLVGYVFMDAARLRLPRSTRELVEMDAPHVRERDLTPGDLLFFSPGGGKASHIGIYVGEGRFVHAPSAGGTVRLDRLDMRYWREAYAGARRVLR